MAELPTNPNVVALFERAARLRGGAPAIVDPRGLELWSFAGLAEAAARLAGALARLDVGPGDRVLVLEPDARRRYAAVAAVLWAGATVTTPPASPAPWQAVAAAARPVPDALIFGPSLWPLVVAHPALRNIGVRAVVTGPRLPGVRVLADIDALPIDPIHVAGEAIALASFTTGSTGRPKPVLRSHGVLHAQHDALAAVRRLSPDDRDLVGLPLLVLDNLGSGVTSIVPPGNAGSSAYASTIRELVGCTRPTSAVGFPPLFEAMASAGAAGLRDLRAMHVGGDRVPSRLLRRLRAAAPSAWISVVYGSTEVEPIASIAADDYLAALATRDPASGVCMGQPATGLEARVEPLPGPATAWSGAVASRAVASRAVGSLQLRGRHVANAGVDGWLATGDVAWIDDERRVWLLGRVANVVGRFRPFELELAIERLDWVRRAVVVRVDDGAEGRLVVGAEPHPGGSISRAEGRQAIGRVAAERGWAIAGVDLGTLPVVRGPSGKVDTRRLARAACTRRVRAIRPLALGHR
jgi:acyl-coenzyme A synthetase/AMP-(fatty) acid ligase